MKQKTLSLISGCFVIAIGLVFLLTAALTLKPAASFYKSSGFYPIILSSAIILCGLVSVIKDVIELRVNKDGERVELGNMKKLLMIVGIMGALLLLWQTLDIFYASMALAVGAIVYIFHATDRPKKKRILFAVIFSVVFTAVAFAVFQLLLGVSFT